MTATCGFCHVNLCAGDLKTGPKFKHLADTGYLTYTRATLQNLVSLLLFLLLTWPLFRQGQGSRRKQALAFFGPRKALPHGSECSHPKIPVEFRPTAHQFCSWRVRCRGLCCWYFLFDDLAIAFDPRNVENLENIFFTV